MLIKRYINNNAKNYFDKILKNLLLKEELSAMDKINIYDWYENYNIKCYVLSNDSLIVNIILCSKMEFDPLNNHISPYTLNYIYTFKDFRRKNYACRMLEYIKSKEEIGCAMCNGVKSTNLFKKANYISTKVPLGEKAEEILGVDSTKIEVEMFRFS